MHGEYIRREQSCIGILIRLIKSSRISFPFISQTVDEARFAVVAYIYKLHFCLVLMILESLYILLESHVSCYHNDINEIMISWLY